ncbi:DEAD/DEAH box helicase family protein [Ruminiclostridium herbifermentans]|uniref:DEAD/DEAH box helicase family protein n=1 Tax=Ruminiclostridium herbifermentans TaxID=2488810 RepID=A0A4U7JJN2_9FIRM|nr:DEAD/DEAH box helicase [Ruminiclostridium herbifermentans]QNU67475.1 DEAD/DEAH box helicase family protein [Ruminiclostridium herbifermentans]
MVRVSDIIPLSEVEKWNTEDIVLINAGTGQGKTTFVKDILIEYCKENNKSILFLVNRIALKKQTKKDIEKKEKNYIANVRLTSYQAITRLLLKNKNNPDKAKAIAHFDYIVCDETHWFFSDALFNNTTDLMWNWLINNSNSIKILMTATALLPKKYIKEVVKKKVKEYKLTTDYNKFIKTLYFYKNDKTIEKILFNLPKDERALYFCGADKAYTLSKLLPDAKFYCSENNKLYKHADEDTFKSIIEKMNFECQILCTTSVLDNGVNFQDTSIKHIIIDYFDLDEIQQMIGRKRLNINNIDDTFTLYIKNLTNQGLNRIRNTNNYLLKQADYLEENGEIEFTNKYFKKSVNNIIDTFTGEDNQIHRKVNKMMYTKIQNLIEIIQKMLKRKKDGYKQAVITRLKYDKKNVFDLDTELDGSILQEYLNSLIGIKLFKEEQKKLKDFLTTNDDLFNPAKTDHKSLGLNSINGYFMDNGLAYAVESNIENSRKSEYYKKTYWIISKK